jgi:lipopolysaccharide/colanic/teichoic acid biosynthesis glycosyltransferase
MIKRLFDFTAALLGLTVLSPILVFVALLIWAQDFHSPFYVAPRAGRGERTFRMVKFRSMVARADRTGVDSTAGNDPRITAVGRFIRKTKLDELPQLWNVLLGQMSLVGPRPNVLRETAIYTPEEKRLLSVRPGMTDLASIVFADEGDILDASVDPDLKYNQVIRPWKSALGLAYVDGHGSVLLDLWIILLTLRAARNRVAALEQVARIAATLGATPELVAVARRRQPLRPTPPPGATTVVRDRTAPPA